MEKSLYISLNLNAKIVDNIINTLNTKGYKNTYGYEIKIVHKYEGSIEYKVDGKFVYSEIVINDIL